MQISKVGVILLAIFFCANIQAQTPQSINYQAVVRDVNGVVVANRPVIFRLTVLSGSASGTPQYSEINVGTTNAFGLVTLNFGLGTPTLGSMSAVTWATGNKYLNVEVDINGGSNFTSMGTTQFLSVPYALYAASSGSNGWSLNGNTTTSANYIGTNNSDDLRLYTEGSQKGVLKANGYLGLGTNSPEARLTIEGIGNGSGSIEDRTFLSINNTSTSFASQASLKLTSGGSPNATSLSHISPTYSVYPNYANYGQLSSSGNGLIIQAPFGVIRFQAGVSAGGVSDRMIVTNSGNVGIGTGTPRAKLEISSGDVYLPDATKGVILTAPNGGCWRVTVDNTGNFVRTSITCPN
jgi:hypothetical protein